MPAIISLDKEKKQIYEHFFNFIAEIKISSSNIPLKKKDFPLYFKLKTDLKELELPNFEEVEKIFLKTQERDKKFKSKWQKEEVDLFIFIVFYLSKKVNLMPENYEREHWQFISRNFLERNWKQCWLKWRNLLRFNPLSKKWSKEEDNHLADIIRNYENLKKPLKWTRIADELFEKGSSKLLRLGKHCRERWNNHLNPTLNKGEWCDEEDVELIEHILKIGKKWSQISREMNGRNEYSVKNRFYYLMKIHKYDANTVSNEELSKIVEKKKENIEAKHQKNLKYQNMLNVNHNANMTAINPNNANFQSFMMNYQNFMNFQNFCYYKKNMDTFFSSMQRMMINPNAANGNINLKLEEEMKKKSVLIEENSISPNIKREENDKKDLEASFTNMFFNNMNPSGNIFNGMTNFNDLALPNVLRTFNAFNNKMGPPF